MLLIPTYRLLQPLSDGTSATLYRGVRTTDGARVILKTATDAHDLEQLVRIRHEHRVIKDIAIPGIVRPLGLEEHDEKLYLILEDFGGLPLSRLIAGRSLDLETKLQIAISLADTLGQLHQKSIVHKDIKPQNIIVSLSLGRTALTDFGIATYLHQETQPAGNPQKLEGTLAYMSPEQTGRMNRSLDYRTDFYSLGVTLYEMLTGALPFQATDAIEIVHSHIARRAVPPHEVAPAIPRVVSDIVMKLLAKTAEDRYQSAHGLKADLAECLARLEGTTQIESFPLALNDISDKFQIPQKLYGREREVASLIAAFEQACEGAAELLLVSGHSGIGKSSLIQEIHKPIVGRRGYFVSGKFNQYTRDAPYAPILQALRELIHLILTESQEQVARFRQRIQSALEPNAQVLVDVLPDLALLIGPQPPVPALDPTASQTRWNLVFLSFLRAVAQPPHPLVLVLDDLQWLDPASLKLLELVMRDKDTRHLLLIGAYRSNEVSPHHPIMMAIAGLTESGVAIHRIELAPLDAVHICRLVSDTLRCDESRAEPLANLVLRRTAGNPFFVNQLLRALHEKGLVRFDTETRRWSWDLKEVEERGMTQDVAELLAHKMKEMPASTQRVCTLAGCIGNRFDLATLALVAQETPAAVAEALWPAVIEELVSPVGNSYRFVTDADDTARPGVSNHEPVLYVFRHDRIQQAACSLLSEDERRKVHVEIGRLLFQGTGEPELEERLFAIVNQFDAGLDLLSDPAEKLRLARLFLLAGRKAKASSAYDAAARWLKSGTALLPETCWTDDYPLACELHLEAAECAHLTDQHERAKELMALLESRVNTDPERVALYRLKAMIGFSRGQFVDSVAAVRQALTIVGVAGVELPGSEEAAGAALKEEMQAARRNLGGRSIEELASLPELTDKRLLLCIHLLADAFHACYVGGLTAQSRVCILKMVNISLMHGSSVVSSFAYVTYGFILTTVESEFQLGDAYGKLALRIGQRYEDPTYYIRAKHMYAIFINHWRNDMRTSIPLHRDVMKSGQEVGDLVYAAYTSLHPPCLGLHLGQRLDQLDAEFRDALVFQERLIRAPHITDYTRIRHQLCRSLLGLTRDRLSLSDDSFDESEALLRWRAARWANGMNWYFITKTQLAYLYGEYRWALEHAMEAERTIESSLGMVITAEHNFYYSLVLLANHDIKGEAERPALLAQAKANQEAMRRWAENCPVNFRDKLLLVEAELARCSGELERAADLYDQAIEAAEASGFVQNQALANELAAKMYIAKGKTKLARSYLIEAHEAYARWGALPKLQMFVETYRALQPKSWSLAQPADTSTTSSHSTKTATGHERGEMLDMMTVVKVSQAISGEIVLDTLLTRLVQIAMENAGAQRGLLALSHGGRLMIEASVSVDEGLGPSRSSTPVEGSTELCEAIVQYVNRTRDPVVLGDATRAGLFTTDPYVVRVQPRSILCIPLLHQGELTGLLYLENNRAADVFIPSRLSLLQLLSAQASIAIRNALLYQHVQLLGESLQEINARLEEHNRTLEEKIAERTAELRGANERLERELLDRQGSEEERIKLKEEIIRVQRLALQELSTPLIPITNQIMVMPLMGVLDTPRIQQVLDALLLGMQRSRAPFVIIDVTGILTVDTQVASVLIRATQALRLLGAQAVISGIRPEVAQTLVRLHVDLSSVATRGTLQSAIAFAMNRLGFTFESGRR